MADDQVIREAQRRAPSMISYGMAWGESPVPQVATASLVAAQAIRPIRVVPMLIAPALLFSSYMNLNGYKKDAAGTTAAWSGLYLLLARRRGHPISQRFGARGLIRGTTMGICLVNVVAGGLVYTLGKREDPTDDSSSSLA